MALISYAKPAADVVATVPEWDAEATKYGFDYEVYTVTTEDKWELTLFRILGNQDNADEDQNPLLIMHGAGLDAVTWVQTYAYGPNADVPLMV